MTGAVETPRAAVNAVAEAYGRYIAWGEKIARGEAPRDVAGSLSVLLDLAMTDEEVLARSVDLTQLLDEQPTPDLPAEILPECRFLAECVSAVPDAEQLRAEISARVGRVRDRLAVPNPEDAPISSDLPEPYEAQWIGIREAAKLLYNQVQLYNADAFASAWEKAAEQSGHPFETSAHRGDDGSVIRTVSVTFDRSSEPPRRRWWQLLRR